MLSLVQMSPRTNCKDMNDLRIKKGSWGKTCKNENYFLVLQHGRKGFPPAEMKE